MKAENVQQALYHRADYEDPILIARSEGFADTWLAEAADLVLGFGNRPPKVECRYAVFAQPFGKNLVAIVQVVDREIDKKSGLAFLVFVLPVPLYERFLGDPFWLVSRLPAEWQPTGSLPLLAIPESPAPSRSVLDLQRVLQRMRGASLADDKDPEAQIRTVENSESPALLGGVQILVDGGRVVFERPTSDSGVAQALWLLLPNSTRSRLWPASFAFCNDLRFDALVVPRASGDNYAGYADEEQAADYPEGRYEHRLQHAAESGDQGEVDALLNRRSQDETRKLALALLVFITIVAVATNFIRFSPREPPQPEIEAKAALAAGAVSAGDPWTAMSLIQIGDERWRQP